MPRIRNRTTDKGSWTEETLKKALKHIEEGNSIRAASKRFNIPYPSLRKRKVNGKWTKPKFGSGATFTPEQETQLVNRVKELADMFYGLTSHDIRRAAFDFAERNDIPHRFSKDAKLAGYDWFQGFLQRNTDISLRKPEATSINRITSFNRAEVNRFFNNLETLQEQYKFKADRIYNCDETCITTVQEPGTVVATKGKKRVGSVTSWERGKLVTVMCAMSAAGNFIPPLFIFPRKKKSPLLEKDGPPSAIYEVSPKGWTNEDIFLVWMKHFIKHSNASKDNPVLLILDNHSTHISLDSYNMCKSNGVVMLSLPPHCSHRLQPLDVTLYSTLKAALRRECDLQMKSNGLKRITPYDIAGLFNRAYTRVATMAVGISGFKATGIFPLNPNIFTDEDFIAADRFGPVADDSIPTLVNISVEVGEEESPTNQTENVCTDLGNPAVSGCSFHEILKFPSKKSCSNKARKKQHSEILTSSPTKNSP